MALTDSQIRSALPADSRYRLNDGAHGLYVCVHPPGGKYFVFRFTWRGKDAELALGTYPKRSLKDARKAAAAAQQLVDQGVDPREERRAAKAIKRPTFREVAEDWFATRTKPSGKDPSRKRQPLAPKTVSKMRWILDDHLYPSPGPRRAFTGSPAARGSWVPYTLHQTASQFGLELVGEIEKLQHVNQQLAGTTEQQRG